MNHNMFAALLFAMLSGMQPENSPKNESKPPKDAAKKTCPEPEHSPVRSTT